MRSLFSFVLLSMFGALGAHAEYPQPPIEAYGALEQISAAEISPDGKKVAAIANVNGSSRVMVLALGGGLITQIGVDNIKARDVEFYDNEHVILQVSETTTTRGFRGKYEYSGAFAINIESGEIKQLLKGAKNLHPAQEGLGQIVGRGRKDGEVLMPVVTGEGTDIPEYDLYRVTLKSPKGRLHKRGSSDTKKWFIGDGGKVLARERYDNRSNTYRVQAWKDESWETLVEETREVPPAAKIGVAPDESGLLYVSTQEDGFNALMKLTFDGDVEGPILPSKDRDVEAYYTDSNQKVVGVRYAGVEPDYAFLEPSLKESFEHVSQALPGGTIYLDSWSDDFDVVLYQVFDVTLGDIWLSHQRSTGALAMVANRRPDIPAVAIGGLYSIEYKARDDLTIQAILTAPPNHVPGDGAPLPAIVIPHGGPSAYDRYDFDWMAQYFANRGYMVVQPNFRGSTGFGREFKRAGRGEWGGKMQDDITDGVAALATAGFIDPDRVCIAGASYGGYAALAGATLTPDLYQCVVAIAPVSDLNRMLDSERRTFGSNHWVVSYWENLMTDGDARRTKLRNISPYNFADQTLAPVLLLHGNDDTVVPYNQSTRMRDALRRADKQVELVKLKGEDHWLSVAETRMQTLREMDAFISEHLPLD